MTNSASFPSVQWFEALAQQMSENREAFLSAGPLDCTMVVGVGGGDSPQLVEVVFEGYSVTSIRALDRLDDAKPDHFVIEATLAVWQEMLDNIKVNGTPDLEHTLNFLTFPDVPMLVSGPDQLQTDAFYRYNESLQRFFNGAAAI